MIKIEHTAPDMFSALNKNEALGWCRFIAVQNETQIVEVFLQDPGDTALLDGLVRAVFFYGLDCGREFASFHADVCKRWRGLLEKEGFSPDEKALVLQLPKKCGKQG